MSDSVTELLEPFRAEIIALRQALAAYRSALRSGEPESDRLREMGDRALSVPPDRTPEGDAG